MKGSKHIKIEAIKLKLKCIWHLTQMRYNCCNGQKNYFKWSTNTLINFQVWESLIQDYFTYLLHYKLLLARDHSLSL